MQFEPISKALPDAHEIESLCSRGENVAPIVCDDQKVTTNPFLHVLSLTDMEWHGCCLVQRTPREVHRRFSRGETFTIRRLARARQ
jgi:hypothetical protein